MSFKALLSLKLQRFRRFAEAELSFHPELNFISGGNAAGKTSLLEALNLLSTGRSFASGTLDHAIQHQAGAFQVSANIQTAQEITLTQRVLKQRGARMSVMQQSSQAKIADLAQSLPAQALLAGAQELIGGRPEVRRQYLDWIVFHVEPGALGIWREYRRALAQRNAGLARGVPTKSLEPWSAVLAERGECWAQLRAAQVMQLETQVRSLASEFGLGPVTLGYRNGWRDGSLDQALLEALPSDARLGYTSVGPQRAELEITLQGRSARQHASRGQQKLLVYALRIAAIQQLNRNQRRSLLLIDDYQSELDSIHQQCVMELVRTLEVQTIFTSLQWGAQSKSDQGHVFHVEQGQVSRLL